MNYVVVEIFRNYEKDLCLDKKEFYKAGRWFDSDCFGIIGLVIVGILWIAYKA